MQERLILCSFQKPLATLLRPLLFVSLLLSGSFACATYDQDLKRASEHFRQDNNDKALAMLRALEPTWENFSVKERAHYAYLRGMTDYRLNFKADARHWLAIATQIDVETPGSLIDEERRMANDKLFELNSVVWSGDVLALEEAPGMHKPTQPITSTSASDAFTPSPMASASAMATPVKSEPPNTKSSSK